MLIAQLSVAGEERHRPVASDRQSDIDSNTAVNTDSDHTAREEFECDRTNLPWVIFRAAHRANHVSTLPARARALLAALARTVDANRPYAAIFARRELLTGRAMQSMRTFYRSVDDLDAAGLITRAPQRRHGEAGLFGRAYLHLTVTAATLLGLVENVSSEAADAGAKLADVSSTMDAHPSAASSQAGSLAAPSASVADGAIYKDLYPRIQKRQPGRLPADLSRLLGLGFHEFLIFKLMREASTHAQRLSDVVEATWEHLQRAKRPISYLRALLRTPVDFSHQVRSRAVTRAEQDRSKLEAEAVLATIQACAGQQFFDAHNTRSFEIADDGESAIVHDARETRSRIAAGKWAPEFVRALAEARLVPATAERRQAFQSLRESHGASLQPRKLADLRSQKPVRTQVIDQRLNDMKRLLRASCAGVSVTGLVTGL